MARKKFKYNPQTLKYEEVNRTVLQQALRILLYISPSIILGFLIGALVVYNYFFNNEDLANQNNQAQAIEIESMKEDINLLNKVAEILRRRDKDLYRMAFYAEDFPEELESEMYAAQNTYSEFLSFSEGELLAETAKKIDQLESKLSAQSISFRELIKVAKNKEKMLKSIPSIQPVNNKDLTQIASGYGMRIDPIYNIEQMHDGMDFSSEIGTDVYATADGVVVACERNEWGYGNCVVINHGFGYKTRYAHLNEFKTKVGAKVKRGDLIGLVGTSGKSTGPHLHYEVEENGVKVNPIFFYHSDLSPEQYEELIKKSKENLKSLD